MSLSVASFVKVLRKGEQKGGEEFWRTPYCDGEKCVICLLFIKIVYQIDSASQ
jgi:hypothetical protein